MKYLSMLERLDEGELVREEDGGWLEKLEVVHGSVSVVEGNPFGGKGCSALVLGLVVGVELAVGEVALGTVGDAG